jgi:glycosyltransferase involved in cell wall biosynthesis
MHTVPSAPTSTSCLRGVRVACFYPWVGFEPSGAWSRFTCLWRYLAGEGARVTIALYQTGADAALQGIDVRYSGAPPTLTGREAESDFQWGLSDLTEFSAAEQEFALRYEKVLYLSQPRVAAWLEQIVAEHDLVTCEYPFQVPLLSEFCRRAGKPLVVTSHDLLYEVHGTNHRVRERLKKQELHALGLADARVYCNEAERRILGQLGLDGIVVLNTGDALALTPGRMEENAELVRNQYKLRTPHYCLFVGSAHGPNVEAVAEVRRMAAAMPDMTFIVAGKCAERAVGQNLIATGPVPEVQLDQLYRGALAVIVPLQRGTGTSVKLFQAFIYGKAVVSTPIGARGYDVSDGRELLLVRRPEDFAAALRRLEQEPGLRLRLEAAAREHAQRLDFRTHFQPYGELINRLLRRPCATGGATPGSGPTGPTLILADNNLLDRVGHHYNYARSLKHECEAAGLPFLAMIKHGASPEVQRELAGVPVFTVGIHEDLPQNPYPESWGPTRGSYDYLRANELFAQELAAGLAQQARPGDTVFLPNATPRQLLGLALLLQHSPLHQHVRYVVILRFSYFYPTGPLANRRRELNRDSVEKYGFALLCLQPMLQAGTVRLATDSAELAKEYAALAGTAPAVLPIPHTHAEGGGGDCPRIPSKSPGVRRIVFLGDAREEKGFELLPAAVSAVLAGTAGREVQFVLHAFISSPYHEPMRPVIRTLADMDPRRVHLLEGPLTQEEYQALLGSADLVLLPYDAVTYQDRTSGPFVEAICAGKPVVIPAGSWMSGLLGQSAAGVTFRSGQAQDFSRAVLSILADLPQRTAAAEALGRQFREFHNPANFLRELLRR